MIVGRVSIRCTVAKVVAALFLCIMTGLVRSVPKNPNNCFDAESSNQCGGDANLLCSDKVQGQPGCCRNEGSPFGAAGLDSCCNHASLCTNGCADGNCPEGPAPIGASCTWDAGCFSNRCKLRHGEARCECSPVLTNGQGATLPQRQCTPGYVLLHPDSCCDGAICSNSAAAPNLFLCCLPAGAPCLDDNPKQCCSGRCINSACESLLNGQCATTSDCASGLACESGLCKSTLDGQCSTISDCAVGLTCQAERCTASGCSWKYLYCSVTTSLFTSAPTTSGSLTTASCQAWCSSGGFTFAGTIDGNQCACGNSLIFLADAGGQCTTPCSGNSAEQCGSPFSTSVYVYICRNDPNWSSPACDAITGTSEIAITSQSLTLSLCRSFCFANGRKIAATKSGNQCHCFSTISLACSAPNCGAATGGCNIACTGAPSEICGGTDSGCTCGTSGVPAYTYQVDQANN